MVSATLAAVVALAALVRSFVPGAFVAPRASAQKRRAYQVALAAEAAVADAVVAEAEVVGGTDVQETPEAVTARLKAGKMHFEDFYCVAKVMHDKGTGLNGPLAAVPEGYEQMIGAMTAEERVSPQLFVATEPSAAQRIMRIAEASGLVEESIARFVGDFGSLQSFFASVSKDKSEKSIVRDIIKELTSKAIVGIEQHTRGKRRQWDIKSKLLTDQGHEKRSKKQAAKGKGFS